jgi:PAS domain S-box-containing protein
MSPEQKTLAALKAEQDALRGELHRFKAVKEENRRLHEALDRLSGVEETLQQEIADRKKAEKIRQQSEDRYTELVEGTHDLVTSVDPEGRFLYLNHKSREIFGLPPDQCLGLSAFDFVHPDDCERTKDWFASLVASRLNYGEIENRQISRSGAVHHMFWTGKVHYDNRGNPKQVNGVARDITKRKRAEEALKESEERHRRLFNQARVGLLRSRLSDGRLIACNEFFARGNGYATVEECLADYDSRGHFADRESGERLIKQLRDSGEVIDYEIEVTTKDGTPVWVSFSAKAYREEDYLEVATVNIDERKKARLALQKSEANLKAIFDNSPQVFILMDNEGIIQALNPTAERLTRSILNLELREGIRLRDFIPAEHLDIFDRYFEAARKGTTGSTERQILDPDGRGHWFTFQFVPVTDPDNRVIGVYYNAIDVQERREAEEAIKESEKRYRLLLNNANDAVYVHEFFPDHPGAFLEVNDQACLMLGYTRDELLRLEVSAIDAPEQKEKIPGIQKKLMDIGKAAFQTDHLTKDGRRIPVEVNTRLFDLQGKPTVLSVVRDITDRKQAEEALQQSETLLNATQELTRVGGWEWDVGKQQMFWTEEVYRIHGIDPGTVTPISPDHITRSLECYGPLDRPVILAAFKRCAENGEPYDLEFPFTTAQGRGIWIRTSGRAVTDQGEIVKVVGNILDISDRKYLELSLKKTSGLLESIHEIQNLFIIGADVREIFQKILDKVVAVTNSEYGFMSELLTDEQGSLYRLSLAISDISWDEASRELYRQLENRQLRFTYMENLAGLPVVSRETLISNDVATDTRSGNLPSGHPPLHTYMGMPLFFGQELVGLLGMANRPGGYDPQLAEFLKPLVGALGSIIHTFKMEDLKQKKETAIKESEERFRQLAENIRDVFWVGSPDWKEFYYVSPAYEELWGRTPLSLYEDPLSWMAAIPEEDRRLVQDDIRKKAGGDLSNPEFPQYRIVRPDGRMAWIKARAYPVLDQAGKIVRIVGLAEDITESRGVQEQINKSLQEKDLLLRELHHRVKNNLQVISSLLSLQMKEMDNPRVGEAFRNSRDRIRSMAPSARIPVSDPGFIPNRRAKICPGYFDQPAKFS